MDDIRPEIEVIEQLLLDGARADSRNADGQAAIWIAWDRKRGDVIELLLRYGADPNAADASEQQNRGTPLCYLISLGRYNGISNNGLRLLQSFVRSGGSLAHNCPHGSSAMASALKINNARTLQALADVGIRLSDESDLVAASRALANAADRRDDAAVAALIALGADVNRKLADRPAPLDIAVARSRATSTALLLSGDGHPHPLHLVFDLPSQSRTQIAKPLIDAGADVEARDGDGRTPLARAAVTNDYGYTRLLIESGADQQAVIWRGRTVVDLAASSLSSLSLLDLFGRSATEKQEVYAKRLTSAVSNRRMQQLEECIAAGLDLNLRGWKKQTALELAGRQKQIEMFQALLDAGADPDTVVLDGSPLLNANLGTRTINRRRELAEGADAAIPMLTAAVLAGNVDLVERLLAAGADPNARSASGDTTLHVAPTALRDVGAAIDVLLQAGADIEAVNSAGFTPLTMAAKHRSLDIMRQLFEQGVDVNAADREGRTALNQTLENGALLGHVEELLERGARPSVEELEKYRRIGGPSLRKVLENYASR